MGLRDELMKIVVKVRDVVALVRRFEESPLEAMGEVVAELQAAATKTVEQLMDAEIDLFLNQPAEEENKRNGFTTRTFTFKGIGAVRVRVPRDRKGKFESKIVPPGRRYDVALEKDLALLHLAGVSTRMLSYVSSRVLGLQVSPQEVSNALATVVPAAKKFLERPLGDRRFMYLYIDGTFFSVQRTTVEKEPTLVVLGVDETGHKSVLAAVQGDKDSKTAWAMVFNQLKERGLQTDAVRVGIMDGLSGLEQAFLDAFPKAVALRCWVHKARNVFPLVPKRYQAEFKSSWDKVQYAASRKAAEAMLAELELRWRVLCGDAVEKLLKDKASLLGHYDFPEEHWDALRTTNPIERVNKEMKRRSKAMETVGADGLKALVAFTALRMEYGWAMAPITSPKLRNLSDYNELHGKMDRLTRELLK
jgi:transposase-like protein